MTLPMVYSKDCHVVSNLVAFSPTSSTRPLNICVFSPISDLLAFLHPATSRGTLQEDMGKTEELVTKELWRNTDTKCPFWS